MANLSVQYQNLNPVPPAIADVGLDQWAFSNGTPLVTTAAVTCLAACVHNRATDSGALAHVNTIVAGLNATRLWEWAACAIRYMIQAAGIQACGTFDLWLGAGRLYTLTGNPMYNLPDVDFPAFLQAYLTTRNVPSTFNLIDDRVPWGVHTDIDPGNVLYAPQLHTVYILSPPEIEQVRQNVQDGLVAVRDIGATCR